MDETNSSNMGMWEPIIIVIPMKHIANKNVSMKAYDFHMFMQQLLSLCICGLLAR